MICPKCGGKVSLRKGKFGNFYGCTSFPKCDFTMDYLRSPEENQSMIVEVINKYKGMILEDLNIEHTKCPDMLFKKHDMNMGYKACFVVENNKTRIDFNLCSLFSSKMVILHVLCHELFHYRDYLDGKLSSYPDIETPYRYKEEEVRAQEYAYSFIDKLLFE